MRVEQKSCVACHREIDGAARICPYCGSDPETGRRFDPKPILEKNFPTREVTARGRITEFFRERQALVVTAVIVGVYLLIGGAHQMASRRAANADPGVPPVPLTELADLNDAATREPLPLPELDFRWTGRAETMNVMLIEPGAVPPPPEEVAAATRAPRPQPPPATTPPAAPGVSPTTPEKSRERPRPAAPAPPRTSPTPPAPTQTAPATTPTETAPTQTAPTTTPTETAPTTAPTETAPPPPPPS